MGEGWEWGHTLYYNIIIVSVCCIEVVPRLTLGLGQGAGVESEAVVMARREVRGGIGPETGHALVNVIHPGSPLGRKRRKNQAKREMVGGECQSVDIVCVHVHVGFYLKFLPGGGGGMGRQKQ